MPIDYVQKIKRKSSADLLGMLDRLKANQPISGWKPGRAFEHIVVRAFEIEKARVVWPFSVYLEGRQIEQIDGTVYLNELHCLIEAKDRDETEGIEPIAKLRNQLTRRPAGTFGLVFTTGQFSMPAKALTRMMNPLSILLWEYDELYFAIQQQAICQALHTKFMYAVEWGMPDYDIRKGLR